MYLNAAERPPHWLLLADSENTTGENTFYKYEFTPVEAPEQRVSFFSIHMDPHEHKFFLNWIGFWKDKSEDSFLYSFYKSK
jgi:hypothetical protein